VLLAAALVVAALVFAAKGRAQSGDRGWLGVAMETAASSGGPAGAAPSPAGVRVTHVIRTSPADKAGIRTGDQLVRVLGKHVDSARDVISLVSTRHEGDVVSVSFVRAGKESTVSVTLGTFPSSDEMLRMDWVGTFAPSWVGLEPLSGAPASIGALRGRVVVLDFWATWCGPCRYVAPVLSNMQTRYGAQGLSVVGITTDPSDVAASFRERTDMRYPVASDPRAETSRAYGVSSLPTLFVIDKRGVVRDVSVGYDPTADARLDAMVRSLLAEPAPTN